jgi:hypothetical protein
VDLHLKTTAQAAASKTPFSQNILDNCLTLKKSAIISRFVMNYKLNLKSYVMFMIFDYVMLYVYGTINLA